MYTAREIQVELDPGLSVPLSVVNQLRREALSGLDQAEPSRPGGAYSPLPTRRKSGGTRARPGLPCPSRRWEQLTPACLDQGAPPWSTSPARWQWSTPRRWGSSFAGIRISPSALSCPGWRGTRELPQLKKELAARRQAGVTEALLGHIGQLPLAKAFGLTPRGDFGLGLTNDLTAQELRRLGFASATASFECRLSQIRDLSKPLDTELLVYGALPLMVTENCIQKNRGQGCHCQDSPQSLRDRKGEAFPVEQAWGCRSEIFNAKTLWLADKDDWRKAGCAYARLAFLREPAEACAGCFRLSCGDVKPPEAFTRGLYYRGVE